MRQLTMTQQLSRELGRVNRIALEEAMRQRRRPQTAGLLDRRLDPADFTARVARSQRRHRADLTIATLGLTLGVVGAALPWLVFFGS